MRNGTRQLLLVPIASLAIAGLMLSCSSLSELEAKPGTELEEATPAGFKLSNLSISPAEVLVRDIVVITAEVTNVTDVGGVYSAELKINNAAEASDEVTIPAGETQPITFATSRDAAGTYKVALGELTGQFVVSEPVSARPDNQTPTVLGQTGASCCGTGGQTSAVPEQAGASCCGTGIQNNPATQPQRTSGCGCGR
jgi:hypothetical protein